MKDRVTPEMRIAVLERDGGCVQPHLTRFGESVVYPDPCNGRLTLDHVQSGYGRMGKRAPSDMAHLVTLCFHHHLDGWATSHRPELRTYLASVEDVHAAHVDPCGLDCRARVAPL